MLWRSHSEGDLKINFYTILCLRSIYPEVCTAETHREYGNLMFATANCNMKGMSSTAKFKFNVSQIENENKNATGEATYAGALRAPCAGSPACVFVSVFVLIYVEFEFQKMQGCCDLGKTSPKFF